MASAAVLQITSASGIISLLDEPRAELKSFALQKLDEIIDEFWAEVADAIQKIEMLHEDKSFPERRLAALVASKVYYHLGSFPEALHYALGAEDLFDVNMPSEYVRTIISKCIDYYIAKRTGARVEEGVSGSVTRGSPQVDTRLEQIVDRMFQRCFEHSQYHQALGIALETRRMDIFRKAILQADDVAGMLSYAFDVTMTLISSRSFRNTVLRCLVELYGNLSVPDYIKVIQCLIFLDDAEATGAILAKLLEENHLLAYQLAFDLYESASQQFLGRVLKHINVTSSPSAVPVSAAEGSTASPPPAVVSPPMVVTEAASTPIAAALHPSPSSSPPSPSPSKLSTLSSILGGDFPIYLQLQFLIRANKTDLQVLKNTKDSVRVSACHTATILANAFMHCGTTSDIFLRDNLDWLSRATNWAKFTATASLGVIHKGHENEALALMQAYLPRDSDTGGGYTEGGGLYALGLIHANHGRNIQDYLYNQLKEAKNEVVRHGGCLGLGLAAMGTQSVEVFELLKQQLHSDDAVVGEAAGLAMGLVMIGSDHGLQEMLRYAQETQHEKIIRGLAVGIALSQYGRLEEAEPLIEQLLSDKDPILRRSAMYTVAVAYAGTGSNMAIRRLLHVAVSDVDQDVRRSAVEALGFILFRTPEQVPSVVSLLAESYNPHVRYGSAMALGIACAGTGLPSALGLLHPLCFDPVNYVRQGALIASGMVCMHQSETACPRSKEFRQLFAKVIPDKHEDVLAKFGAIIAQGIIDAGGRNMGMSLQSPTGHTSMTSVVGMLVFTQYWFWFPFSHFISLALQPTSVILLNQDLKMPKMKIRSAAKPSLYAYPPMLPEKKKEEREKVTATAVLSISAKHQKTRASSAASSASVKKEDKPLPMDTTTGEEGQVKPASAGKDSGPVKEAKEKEPSEELVENPARILKQQLKVISLEDSSRYRPLKPISLGGIIVVQDGKPDQPQDFLEPVVARGPQVEPQGEEPPPPEPFEFNED
ncbi:unnamed protein product [Cyprideis torosa]|uniref:26S proteasome non-ATPase regulatory subunit 1 n=1 Tax=Cyprideis torosa TaxID=163714 RepID=A0A7R8WRU7_9CRUS|nr:unnamed protein product [Cyprideis torosa]CAG0904194.1 unnamed protein product [Cyprideis torosa]